MKQHIDKNQWNELSEKQKIALLGFFNTGVKEIDVKLAVMSMFGYVPLNIGQLIEFLGDDLEDIKQFEKVEFYKHHWIVKIKSRESIRRPELTDAIWSACKQKLNET